MSDNSEPDVILVPFAGRLIRIPRADIPTGDKVSLDTAVESMRRFGEAVTAFTTGVKTVAECFSMATSALLPVAREAQKRLIELLSRAAHKQKDK
jgi:hypothetical protein